MERIVEIGKSADSTHVAQRAFDVLECVGHSGAVDLLVHWVSETDDERFSQLQPRNFLSNVRFYGLDNKIRKAMYELLESESGRDVTERISGVLSAVRRAY